MFAKKEEPVGRFISDRKHPSGSQIYVLVDAATGVNYMAVAFGTSISVTPLLNPNGTPIVSRPS